MPYVPAMETVAPLSVPDAMSYVSGALSTSAPDRTPDSVANVSAAAVSVIAIDDGAARVGVSSVPVIETTSVRDALSEPSDAETVNTSVASVASALIAASFGT